MAAADLDPSASLCLCGARGCEQAAAHRAALVEPVPRFRLRSRGARRHKRRR